MHKYIDKKTGQWIEPPKDESRVAYECMHCGLRMSSVESQQLHVALAMYHHTLQCSENPLVNRLAELEGQLDSVLDDCREFREKHEKATEMIRKIKAAVYRTRNQSLRREVTHILKGRL